MLDNNKAKKGKVYQNRQIQRSAYPKLIGFPQQLSSSIKDRNAMIVVPKSNPSSAETINQIKTIDRDGFSSISFPGRKRLIFRLPVFTAFLADPGAMIATVA
jgi:hypothetical protein